MGRIDKGLGRAVQTALRLVYPPRCHCCGGGVEGEAGICTDCWQDMPFVRGTVCDGCGVPLRTDGEGPAGEHFVCEPCSRRPPPWQMARAPLLYESAARQLILALKHGGRTEIAAPASEWMVEAATPMLETGMIVAPVPLHWRRRVRRGYNQSALMSRAIARRLRLLDALDIPDLLERRVATPSLDHRGAEERRAILDGSISVTPRHRERLLGRPVLLIDDVLTTGATFSAATRACLKAGSGPVSVLALARVAKDA